MIDIKHIPCIIKVLNEVFTILQPGDVVLCTKCMLRVEDLYCVSDNIFVYRGIRECDPIFTTLSGIDVLCAILYDSRLSSRECELTSSYNFIKRVT